MRHSFIVVLFAALRLSAQQPGVVTGPTHGSGQISTSATGEARYVPNRATISLGVQTRALTAARASADNASTQRAVIDALRAQGIAADQISTTDYNLSAVQSYEPNATVKAPRIIGYMVTNTVQVEVKRVEQVGALIDAAIAKGANEVSALSFHSSAPDSLRRVALRDAFEQARADAVVLATAAGGHLGDLIDMTTSGAMNPPPRLEMLAGKAPTMTPVNVGELTSSVVVLARWRFVADGK